jgi:hypothetical protein
MGTWCAGLPRVDTSPVPVTPAAAGALPVPRTGRGERQTEMWAGTGLGRETPRGAARRGGGRRVARPGRGAWRRQMQARATYVAG